MQRFEELFSNEKYLKKPSSFGFVIRMFGAYRIYNPG